MDIKITDSWLREYLKTDLSPKKIGEQLALCGPSVEKITKKNSDYIYDIEVTTNRVDCMSILGIAREGYSILPGAKLLIPKIEKIKHESSKDLLHIKVDPKLVNRVMAVVMEVGEKLETPKVMNERLINSG